MVEKANIPTREDFFSDIVLQDSIDFAVIEDGVLDNVSCLTANFQ